MTIQLLGQNPFNFGFGKASAELREQQICVSLDYNGDAILQITCSLKLLTVRCFRNIDILPRVQKPQSQLLSSDNLTTHFTYVNETIPSPHNNYKNIFQLLCYRAAWREVLIQACISFINYVHSMVLTESFSGEKTEDII